MYAFLMLIRLNISLILGPAGDPKTVEEKIFLSYTCLPDPNSNSHFSFLYEEVF